MHRFCILTLKNTIANYFSVNKRIFLQGLRKHQQSIHGAPGSKEYNCPDCQLVSTNLGNVLRHNLIVHKTLRRFICSICLAQYSQNQELKSHLNAKHRVIIDSINSQEKKSISEVCV